MKYTIRFAQWYEYDVEADNEDKAIDLAKRDFYAEVNSPIANTLYDEIIVEDEDGQELYHV